MVCDESEAAFNLSLVTCHCLRYFAVQPGFCQLPLANDGRRSHTELFGRLFDRESAEETQLDDAAFLRVDLGQSLHRFVEHDQVCGPLNREVDDIIER